MIRARDFFPLGVATGTAFCNRQVETDLLLANIRNNKHTLLMATRRYGKSSLALHAIKLSEIPYAEIDFYMASNEKIIESYVLNAVVNLIGKALGKTEKFINSIKNYVKTLKPKLDIGSENFKLELTSDAESDPANNIKEALMLLEKMLAEKNKYAVLLMDEFQNVGVIAEGKGIEGAIRHIAQKTKHLTFIFSGSNRKLLKTMFEDENRPLYKLCWKIVVKRISNEHYTAHIQKAAKAAWQKEINQEIIDSILLLTEKHPFYLNKLCDKLWTYYAKAPPTVKSVENAWQEILEEEQSDVVKEISSLSAGQKNVLLQIAKQEFAQLTSKKTILELKMSSSSIMAALEALEEKDIIEKIENMYQIINPTLKYYVLKAALGLN